MHCARFSLEWPVSNWMGPSFFLCVSLLNIMQHFHGQHTQKGIINISTCGLPERELFAAGQATKLRNSSGWKPLQWPHKWCIVMVSKHAGPWHSSGFRRRDCLIPIQACIRDHYVISSDYPQDKLQNLSCNWGLVKIICNGDQKILENGNGVTCDPSLWTFYNQIELKFSK